MASDGVIEVWVNCTKWNQDKNIKYRQIPCKECGQFTFVSNKTVEITCSDCVRDMVDPPIIKSTKKSTKPRGWAFMKEFVDADGTVYHRGVEQPKLKGTLEPTKVEVKPKLKLSKAQKSNIITDASKTVSKLKRELSKVKYKKDKSRIERQIKKLNKLLSLKTIPSDYVKYFPKNK